MRYATRGGEECCLVNLRQFHDIFDSNNSQRLKFVEKKYWRIKRKNQNVLKNNWMVY